MIQKKNVTFIQFYQIFKAKFSMSFFQLVLSKLNEIVLVILIKKTFHLPVSKKKKKKTISKMIRHNLDINYIKWISDSSVFSSLTSSIENVFSGVTVFLPIVIFLTLLN